jgi:hypothetical protein
MEILVSFIVGFIASWIMSKPIEFNQIDDDTLKDSMIEIAINYKYNTEICEELKKYSMSKIYDGAYCYAEVIDVIKRNKNDKTRT